MSFIGSILPLTINSENAWSFQTAVTGNNFWGVPQMDTYSLYQKLNNSKNLPQIFLFLTRSEEPVSYILIHPHCTFMGVLQFSSPFTYMKYNSPVSQVG